MVTKLVEAPHAGGFVKSEANGARSRENVTIATTQVLKAGTVLGRLTSGGHYVPFDNDLADGSETAVAVLIHPIDTTGGAKQAAVIARDAEVLGEELVWKSDNDGDDIAAGVVELASLGIIVR